MSKITVMLIATSHEHKPSRLGKELAWYINCSFYVRHPGYKISKYIKSEGKESLWHMGRGSSRGTVPFI